MQAPPQTRKAKEANSDSAKDGLAYSCLLKNELLSAGIEDLKVGVIPEIAKSQHRVIVFAITFW